mgnify:CR=1 FL=1
MLRSEPLVDWIEIHDTIVAVMNVDANTNRISFEARPLHGRPLPARCLGSGAWSSVLTVPTTLLRLSTRLAGARLTGRGLWIREVASPPRGGRGSGLRVGTVTCRDATEIGPRAFAAPGRVHYSAP